MAISKLTSADFKREVEDRDGRVVVDFYDDRDGAHYSGGHDPSGRCVGVRSDQRGHEIGLDAPHAVLRLIEGISGDVDVAMTAATTPWKRARKTTSSTRAEVRITSAGEPTMTRWQCSMESKASLVGSASRSTSLPTLLPMGTL